MEREKKHGGICHVQFWELFPVAGAQYITLQTRMVVWTQKNLVSLLSWNQGNHNMGHLWIQIDHNLDHKCPDHGQPVTRNMNDQTMISLESCSMYYDRE